MPSLHLPYLWMLCGAAAFAVMAVLTSELRQQFSWPWIAAARSGWAFLFAALLVLLSGSQFLILRPLTLWWRSIAGSISLLCGFYAMTHYDVSVVLTLTNVYPIWVAILSWPMLGVVPSTDTWLAAVLSVAGVAVLASDIPAADTLSPERLSSLRDVVAAADMPQGFGAHWAIGASLVSAFTSAVALLGLHRLRGLDHRAVVVHFSGTAFVFCLVAAAFWPEVAVHEPHPPLVWGLLFAVGLSATVGQLFLTRAFAYGDPARVSVVGLSQVCFAMLLESAWHHRTYSVRSLLGMAMVILPTAWVMWRSRYRRHGHDEPLATPPDSESPDWRVSDKGGAVVEQAEMVIASSRHTE